MGQVYRSFDILFKFKCKYQVQNATQTSVCGQHHGLNLNLILALEFN